MSFIEKKDEDDVVKALFGNLPSGIDADSFSACFEAFNKAVEKSTSFVFDSDALIDGKAVISPSFLSEVIGTIKAVPTVTLHELQDKILLKNGATIAPVDASTYRNAVNELIEASVSAFLLIDCPIRDVNRVPIGVPRHNQLKTNDEFAQFLKRSVPRGTQNIHIREQERHHLKAWKIEKRGRVRFCPTSNIAEHLHYDSKQRVVFLFQHVNFLKAQLQLAGRKDARGVLEVDREADFTESVPKGILPPRLVFETLSTWYSILFSGDDKSEKLLRKLVWSRADVFKHECQNTYGASVQRTDHADFFYCYWGERLTTLHRLSTEPDPIWPLFKYLDRKKPDRFALYVAILGLFLGALFGLLGLIVGIIQTVLAYQSLRH